jgi:hypothetical protein
VAPQRTLDGFGAFRAPQPPPSPWRGFRRPRPQDHRAGLLRAERRHRGGPARWSPATASGARHQSLANPRPAHRPGRHHRPARRLLALALLLALDTLSCCLGGYLAKSAGGWPAPARAEVRAALRRRWRSRHL